MKKIKVVSRTIKGKNGESFISYKAIAANGAKIDCRIVKDARVKLEKETTVDKTHNLLFELSEEMYNVSKKYEYDRVYISDYVTVKDLGVGSSSARKIEF